VSDSPTIIGVAHTVSYTNTNMGVSHTYRGVGPLCLTSKRVGHNASHQNVKEFSVLHRKVRDSPTQRFPQCKLR